MAAIFSLRLILGGQIREVRGVAILKLLIWLGNCILIRCYTARVKPRVEQRRSLSLVESGVLGFGVSWEVAGTLQSGCTVLLCVGLTGRD
jgi:hypothetical protein